MRLLFNLKCFLLFILFSFDIVVAAEYEYLTPVQTYECDAWGGPYQTGKYLSWVEAFEKIRRDDRNGKFTAPIPFTANSVYLQENESTVRPYLCSVVGTNLVSSEPATIYLDAITVEHTCYYSKGDEVIKIGTGSLIDVDGEPKCPVAKACNCDENLESGQCISMQEDYSVEYEPNIAKLYQYPTNNQGLRCEPEIIDELDSCPVDNPSSDSTKFGNPIDCATGQKVQTDTDYQGAGTDPLRYTRAYQSPLSSDASASADTANPWLNAGQPAFSQQTLGDGSLLGLFTIGHRVKRVLFSASGSSGWSSNPYMATLGMSDTVGRRIAYRGKTYQFNSTGQAETAESHGIQRYFYSYNDAGQVAEIRNRFGAFLQFTYDTDNRLIQLTDQAGSEVHYSYDTQGNLHEVIYPDATPGDLSDNPRKTYLYENSALPFHLTGILDESGLRYASFDYDATGRGILTEHADGAERVVISYPEEGRAIARFYRDADNDLYREEAYTYGKFRGAYQLTSRTIQVCNDCALGSETWLHDYKGLLLKHTGMNGAVTAYGYDGDGRKLTQTIGLGSPLSRTITYTWDTDLEKILTATTSSTVTTYNYDANGLLLSKTIIPVE